MSSKNSDKMPENPENELERLIRKNDSTRFENEVLLDAIKRLVRTHEVESEAVEELKRTIEAQKAAFENTENILHREIRALRHGYEVVVEFRNYFQSQSNKRLDEVENSKRKIDYLNRVIERNQKLFDRLDEECARRQAYIEDLMSNDELKSALAKAGIELPVLDLHGLLEVPEPSKEHEYLKIAPDKPPPTDAPFTDTEQFDVQRVDTKYFSALEYPRSFVSRAIGQKVVFGGWCFDEDGKAAVSIWAQTGETETPFAIGGERPEIAEIYADKAPVETSIGFSGEVSTGPGENFVELWAEFQDGSKALMYKRIIVNLGFETTPKRQLDDDYQTWINCFDRFDDDKRRAVRKEIEDWVNPPLISILLPTYNTPAKLLAEAIESVRGQVYENWELCIADDASPEPHVKALLKHYSDLDDRIKVVFRKENGHISAATNSALEIAKGEFCALLDHDDVLPANALYENAKLILENPEANLIFSDEDKIDGDGKRFDPYFKPDWNPDLFLSHNCISHFGLYRTEVLRKIDGFDETLNGSQDWDLALRFIAEVDHKGICHIPKILYHWRYLETSTAKSIDSKPYAIDAGKRAIKKYLQNRGDKAEVGQGLWVGAYRVRYELPENTLASVIIPARNQWKVTKRCIDTLLGKTEGDFEILYVDNGSDEPETIEYRESLKDEDRIRVLSYDKPFNFSAINNYAASEAKGDVLVFLNNDIEVIESGWLMELISQASREEIGAAGGWLLYPDHTVQHAGILMGVCGIAVEAYKHNLEWNIGHMGRAHLNQAYSAVTGACLATRKSVFEKAEGFNEKDLAVAYNDVDYCLRLKRDKGLRTVWTPYAKLIHHESVSRGYEQSPEQIARFEKEATYMRDQWSDVIRSDPNYNPNLSKFDTMSSLAWPPRTSS